MSHAMGHGQGDTGVRDGRRVRRGAFMVVAALAVTWLVACESNQTQVRSTGDARETSEVQDLTLSVPLEADRVELHLELDVEAGAATWGLIDPNGDVREEGSTRSGQPADRDLRFDPISGDWELRVELEAVTGTYDMRLGARW